jgi:hypothetical protein
VRLASTKRGPTPQPKSNDHDEELAQALRGFEMSKYERYNPAAAVEVPLVPPSTSNITDNKKPVKTPRAPCMTKDNYSSAKSKAVEVNSTPQSASIITDENKSSEALGGPRMTEDDLSNKPKAVEVSQTPQSALNITDDKKSIKVPEAPRITEDDFSNKSKDVEVSLTPQSASNITEDNKSFQALVASPGGDERPDPRIHPTYVIGGLIPKSSKKRIENDEIPGWGPSDVRFRFAKEKGKSAEIVAL